MDKPEKRIDLNSELGMSRRDLLRRSAIVGGTLLWVAPAIESIAPKAFAQTRTLAPSSPGCAACYCWNTKNGHLKHDTALHGGIHSGGLLNSEDCANYCLSVATDPKGKHFTNSIYCSGPANCEGVAKDDLDGTLPASISCSNPSTFTRLTGPDANYGVICCDN
ncbi:MAG: hypothetical protein ACRDH7_04860 [Actinomycetota bacterium]